MKGACGLDIGDGKGQIKRRETDIDKLLQKSANFKTCITPFNKIVGNFGTLALRKGIWRVATL